MQVYSGAVAVTSLRDCSLITLDCNHDYVIANHDCVMTETLSMQPEAAKEVRDSLLHLCCNHS